MLADLCLSTVSYPPPRTQAGDILGVRDCADYIGLLEGHECLWIRVDLDPVLLGQLQQAGSGRKHRYALPLAALTAVIPGFDVGRARDRRVVYQPVLETHPTTGISSRVPSGTWVREVRVGDRVRRGVVIPGHVRCYVEAGETPAARAARWQSQSIDITALLIDHGPAVVEP